MDELRDKEFLLSLLKTVTIGAFKAKLYGIFSVFSSVNGGGKYLFSLFYTIWFYFFKFMFNVEFASTSFENDRCRFTLNYRWSGFPRISTIDLLSSKRFTFLISFTAWSFFAIFVFSKFWVFFIFRFKNRKIYRNFLSRFIFFWYLLKLILFLSYLFELSFLICFKVLIFNVIINFWGLVKFIDNFFFFIRYYSF